MKVKLLVSVAGSDHIHGKGSIVDMEPAEAKRYIESGQAIEMHEVERAIQSDSSVETNVSQASAKHKKQRPS
jgi:hypothetical protein